jgi:hypothetical protein
VLTMPAFSDEITAEAGGAVHLRVGERFVAPVVPAQADARRTLILDLRETLSNGRS